MQLRKLLELASSVATRCGQEAGLEVGLVIGAALPVRSAAVGARKELSEYGPQQGQAAADSGEVHF